VRQLNVPSSPHKARQSIANEPEAEGHTVLLLPLKSAMAKLVRAAPSIAPPQMRPMYIWLAVPFGISCWVMPSGTAGVAPESTHWQSMT